MSDQVSTQNLKLKIGAALILSAGTSGLLVYGVITEATWLETFKALVAGIFGG